MRRHALLMMLLSGWAASIWAQNTVGTTVYDPTNVFDGYTLIYPHNQPHAYLLNFCGEVVHQWESDADSRPGNTAYLMPNGDLLMTRRPASIAGNPIWAGGGGATIERRTWENEVIWSYTQNDDSARFHHDIAPMPNGNVLAICWEAIDSTAALAAGANPETLMGVGLWSEKVVELAPDGSGGAEVVWEWRLWDHLIQDMNPEAANFGVVAENPNKVDLNYPTPENLPADFVHMNSIDYNPLNDHILLSAPEFDEVWIIDHSPFSNGDLKWRWGNPEAYDTADSTQHHLHYQHDANWVDEPYQMGSPFLGKISIFNNRVPGEEGERSALTVVAPPYDEYENQYLIQDGVFAPSAPDWNWQAADPLSFSSGGLSSFQPLAGPRFLVCEGRAGRISEITLAGDTVWQYVTPLQGGVPVAQGTELLPAANMTFRATRYPAVWPIFSGLDGLDAAVIELDPEPLPACLPCALEVSVESDGTGFQLDIAGGTAPFEITWMNSQGNTCTAPYLPFDPEDLAVLCGWSFELVTLQGYYVNVEVVDALGCAATAEGYWAGVAESDGRAWVWPNPASNQLQLQGFPNGCRAQLLDVSGRIVAERTLFGRTSWNLPSLPSGMYILAAGDVRERIQITQP